MNELEIGIIYNSLTGNFSIQFHDLRDQYCENQYWLVGCGTIAYNRRVTVQPHLGFQKFDIDILHHESLGGSVKSDNVILSLMLQKSKYLQVVGPEI